MPRALFGRVSDRTYPAGPVYAIAVSRITCIADVPLVGRVEQQWDSVRRSSDGRMMDREMRLPRTN